MSDTYLYGTKSRKIIALIRDLGIVHPSESHFTTDMKPPRIFYNTYPAKNGFNSNAKEMFSIYSYNFTIYMYVNDFVKKEF